MKNFLLPLIILSTTNFYQAQNTNISGVINSYESVSNITGNSITVNSSASFSVGDLVLIIQMQGATINETNTASFGDIISLNNAGNYEFTTVCAIPSATNISLTSIQRSYDITGIVQVVRVPVYDDATITGTLMAAPWNGSTGGVLAFQCNDSLTMNNGINLQGVGFRGGAITTSAYNCNWFINVNDYYYDISTGEGAKKGEGIASYIVGKTGGSGAQSNGGGGGNDHNSGGGGGANAGNGGAGGERIRPTTFSCAGQNPGVGGKPNTYSNISNKAYLGGGGGAGHENNANTATPGANGGGIVMIKSNVLVGNSNNINVEGGLNISNSGDGAGGGGAGGSVLLDVTSYVGNLNINTSGSQGGDVSNVGSANCNGPGGGGSGGLLWVSQPTLPTNILLSNTGGNAGTTLNSSQTNCSVSGNNNAQNGAPGITLTGLSFVESTCNTITINQSIAICATDSIFLGGAWQNTANVYYDTISTSCCDTIVESTLSIYPTLIDTINQTICNGDSIIVNGTTYNSSVTGATEVLLNAGVNGCDSIIIINLTVLPQITGTDLVTACNSFIWIDGNTYTTNNNTATFNIPNGAANSCDSLVFLELTINTIDTSVTQNGPNLSANLSGVSYQWLNCDSNYAIINGATNQNYTATMNGNYAVIVSQSSCTDTSSCHTVVITGIIENDFGKKILVYPNPTKGNVTIDLGAVYKNITLKIRSVTGSLLNTEKISNSNKLTFQIDEAPGIYVIEITTSEHKKGVIRIIKE